MFVQLIHRAKLPIPATLTAALIDQLVCSRARYLLLNVFSTFSQLVMGFIGLRASHTVGWVRDLTDAQQRTLGVNVTFLRQLRVKSR